MALREFHTDVDLKGRLYLGGSAGTSGKVLTSNGPDNPPTWETPAGGDSVTIASSAADVLSAGSGEISADDAGSDKLVFWDDSAGKLTYLTVGSGLTISGTEITTGGSFRVLHEWDAPYDYLARASSSASEEDETWLITRLTIDPSGFVTTTETATDVAWTDRLTATYS